MNENSSRESSDRLAILLVLLLLHAACGLVILWLLLKFVPQYEKIFKDFGTKLPDMTIMVINLSTFVGRWWFLVVPGLGAGDVAIMLSLNGTRQTRLMTALGILLWLAQMLLMGLIVAACAIPLNALIMNLSGGK